jgi:hypothetical protein
MMPLWRKPQFSDAQRFLQFVLRTTQFTLPALNTRYGFVKLGLRRFQQANVHAGLELTWCFAITLTPELGFCGNWQ